MENKRRLLFFSITLFLILVIGIVSVTSAQDSSSDTKIKYENVELAKDNQGRDIYTFNQGGYITVDGKTRYDNFEPGGKLVFKNGKIAEAEFTVSKASIYRFGNYEIELPKGAKFSLTEIYINSEFVGRTGFVTLPGNSKVVAPEKIGNDKDGEITFSFQTEKGKDLILENGEVFKGVLENGEREEASLFFDGKRELFFIEEKVEIGNLKIGGADPNNRIAYLFFDGKEHPEFSEPYISLGDASNNYKFNAGSPKGKIGPSVEFLEGNKYGGMEIKDNKKFIIQARGGQISVESRASENKIPKVTTKGYFYIIVGNQLIRFEQGLNEPYFHSSVKINGEALTGFSTTPMQLISLDDNGNRLIRNWDIIIDNNNKIEPVSIQYADKLAAIGRKGTPVSQKTEFYELDQDKRKIVAELTKEQQLEFFKNPGQDFDEFLRRIGERVDGVTGSEGGGSVSVGESTTSTSASFDEKIKFMTFGKTGPYKSALQDIIDHQGQIRYSSDDDLGHETVHGINAMLRNKHGGTGDVNAFYLLNGKYVVLKEPNVKLSDVAAYVPSNLRERGSYSLYIVGQRQDWNNEPLYVLDELTAYTNGGIVSVQTGGRKSMNIPDFMTYSISLGRAIHQKDPNYWNSPHGERFKNFLGYSLERSTAVHISQTGDRNKALQIFREMTDTQTQNFARETFGSAWTQRVLGF